MASCQSIEVLISPDDIQGFPWTSSSRENHVPEVPSPAIVDEFEINKSLLKKTRVFREKPIQIVVDLDFQGTYC